ncbi:uncharacterized protein LOC143485908 [Brachyhypopomus gauderio]|uniref:uncharacterized protein LOC143485908 n=1 Tax=Brachyhypopomus gauderio TaxID=698409 RepID=UPI004041DFF0
MMLTFPTFFHRVIERLQESIKNQDALIGELQKKCPEQPVTEQMAQLSVLIGQKDKELQALKNELDQERQKTEKENQACSLKQEELNRLQQTAKQLSEDLQSTKNSSQTLKHRLEEMDRENKALSAELEQRNGELGVERRNSLKRDKIIQGLSLLLKEKEKEVEELYGNLEEKEKILAKTREALHKAQLQKHQACSLKQEELNRLQQTAKQLSEDLQSTKNSSQTLKHRLEEMDRENKALSAELEQRNGELGVERRNSLKRDKIIQGLSLLLKEKEKEVEELYGNLEEKEKILAKTREALHKAQLQKHQDYMNMVWDLEQDRAPSDITLTKLRERLREKEKALESFDTLLKEKDVELQQLVNTVKTVQRSSQESEASLQGALNEKDSIIQQLQHSLQLKTTDVEKLLAQVQERGGPVAQLKVSEALPTQVLELRQTIEVLQEKLKKREAQISRRNSEVNSPPVSIKATVLLKKELAQKTQALNRALRRENQLKAASGTMLLVLEEAERLLELFWRVTLPSGDLTHTLQEEVLRSEVSRLQSWLSQQERMLTGAVKRLRSNNQLREGMEHIIIDQLSMTHGVLKKARENLEEITLDAQ